MHANTQGCIDLCEGCMPCANSANKSKQALSQVILHVLPLWKPMLSGKSICLAFAVLLINQVAGQRINAASKEVCLYMEAAVSF